jgi:hypothetical protein
MNSILKRLHEFDEDELLGISAAIDVELEQRLNRSEGIPESARQRAISRERSYRHGTGSAAPPIRTVGLRKVNGYRVI